MVRQGSEGKYLHSLIIFLEHGAGGREALGDARKSMEEDKDVGIQKVRAKQ